MISSIVAVQTTQQRTTAATKRAHSQGGGVTHISLAMAGDQAVGKNCRSAYAHVQGWKMGSKPPQAGRQGFL